jgi:hypothetical protein
MGKIKVIFLIAFFSVAGGSISSLAGTMLGGTVSTTLGQWDGTSPISTITDQSGLSGGGYTSGVTDFDTYVATATHSWQHDDTHHNEWFSNPGPTGTTGNIVFDLGGVYNISKLAMWNEDSYGVKGFTISFSMDGITYGGDQSFTAANNPFGSDYKAQIFLLSTTLAKYIKIHIIDGYNVNVVSLGEIAFDASAVPEPTTLLLLGTGLVGLAGMRRKK